MILGHNYTHGIGGVVVRAVGNFQLSFPNAGSKPSGSGRASEVKISAKLICKNDPLYYYMHSIKTIQHHQSSLSPSSFKNMPYVCM